jgi:hypothetical protein
MRRRIDIEPDVLQLRHEPGIAGQLELAHAVQLQSMGPSDPLHRTDADADRFGHHCGRPMRRLAQWIAERQCQRAFPQLVGSGGMREGRVRSGNRPVTAARMSRSCQRHTVPLLIPVRRMISLVPTPSAVSNTIRARQTCFVGYSGHSRSLPVAPDRPRSRRH